jgi:hypothetical protein
LRLQPNFKFEVQPFQDFVIDVLEVDEEIPFREVAMVFASLDLDSECLHLGQLIDMFRPEILFAKLSASRLKPHVPGKRSSAGGLARQKRSGADSTIFTVGADGFALGKTHRHRRWYAIIRILRKWFFYFYRAPSDELF